MERHAEQFVHLSENCDARGKDASARAIDVEPLGDLPRRIRLDEL